MKKACETGGTGWPLFGFKYLLLAKQEQQNWGHTKTTHAWFTAFAPIEDPEISVTVLVEGLEKEVI